MTDLQRAQELFARTGDMRYWDLMNELAELRIRTVVKTSVCVSQTGERLLMPRHKNIVG
jgi:hypothetical protein